jgi:hypothetical protein
VPKFNLRDGEVLTPLAAYKVLAVMCHPDNVTQRERMIGYVRVNSDVGGPTRRRPLSKVEFDSDVHTFPRKAVVAGSLLLTKLQLSLNGHPFSLNRTIPLVRALLPKWIHPYCDSSWPRNSMSRQWPRSRRGMLEAWHQFRPVAHLWAALIHVAQHHDSLENWRWGHQLPEFLAFADTILDMAASLPSFERGQRLTLNRDEAWTFVLPERLILKKTLQGLPLQEQQLAVLQRG